MTNAKLNRVRLLERAKLPGGIDRRMISTIIDGWPDDLSVAVFAALSRRLNVSELPNEELVRIALAGPPFTLEMVDQILATLAEGNDDNA